jgi:hypothetical protein
MGPGMTNHNTDWKTQVHVLDRPDQMSYRGDFCCGDYATVIVKGYGTTQGSSPDEHIQAGEIVTIGYDTDATAMYSNNWEAVHLPYQPGVAESTLTARPTRVPDLTQHSVTPKIKYITDYPTTGKPNMVGVVLVDPFPVDPQNVDGHGPAGNDVWITHIALRGFCLVKDKRRQNSAQYASSYEPGRLVTLTGTPEFFGNPPNKNNTNGVYCMVNILDDNRQSTMHLEAQIGTYHRVVAWGGTDRDSGHRGGFPGHNTGYGGQDILLIHLTGGYDTGYAV